MVSKSKRRNRTKHATEKAGEDPRKFVTVHMWKLSAAKLKALSETDRYVFALVCHMHNELMALQKMVLIAKPPLSAPGPLKDAGLGLTMLMLKTLLGKTYEALDTLNKPKIADRLRANFFQDPLHLQHWEDALDRFAKADWLQALRNRHAFHYMSEGQWRDTLIDENLFDGAQVVLGTTYGNTFYHWADAMAALPMLRVVNPTEPFEGLGTILDDIGALLGRLLGALAEGVGRYIDRELTGPDALGPEVMFRSPTIDEFRVPALFAK